MLFKNPNNAPNIVATIVIKFVIKNFQNLPNLVSLIMTMAMTNNNILNCKM